MTTRKTNLSRDFCEAVLATRALVLLPGISTIANCPVVYEISAGQPEIHRLGYLEYADGIFVIGGESKEVPLKEAITIIESLFTDFLFLTPADYSRAIAMLITPALVQGGFIRDRIPGDFAEADDSQAGKGYRHDLVAAVYNDTATLVTQNTGGVGSLDEKFAEALLTGKTFVRLDNLRDKLNSPTIESFFTTAYGFEFTARAFRKSGKVKAGKNIIQASSNNATGTRDIANRMCIVRIRKRPMNHPWAKFPEGHLLKHVQANQGKFLGAVHAIVMEWIRQGKQCTNEHRHDFREWCGILDWILTNLFKRPGMMDGHQEIQKRTSTPVVSALRELAINLERDGKLPCDLLASQIVELAVEYGIDLELRARDTETCARVLGGKLGSLFKRDGMLVTENLFRDEAIVVTIDEYQITRWLEKVLRDDGKGYHDTKHYRFMRKP